MPLSSRDSTLAAWFFSKVCHSTSMLFRNSCLSANDNWFIFTSLRCRTCQAFNTGDPIKRKQPLFVRMPTDGVPRDSRGVWVHLLKTVNGLTDGTREWRNCFLAAARGLEFVTSVLEPCVLVSRSTQQKIPRHHLGGR